MAKNKTIAFRTSDENRKRWEENAEKSGMNLTDYIHQSIEKAEKGEEQINHLKVTLEFVLHTFKTTRLLEEQLEGTQVEPAKIKRLKDATFDAMMQGLNLVYKQGKLPKDLKKHLSTKIVEL